MRVVLIRDEQELQSPGKLIIFGDGEDYTCCTLELPWLNNAKRISCIPKGKYTTVRRTSDKYGDHFHVKGVTGRSYILIHFGNYAGSMNPRTGKSDILGCILPGKAHLDINSDGISDVTSSKNTMRDLNAILPDSFMLEII